MNEQVTKAIQTLKNYCTGNSCDNCAMLDTSHMCCCLQCRPVEWIENDVIMRFEDEKNIPQVKAAQAVIDYCNQTDCVSCPMYLSTNIGDKMCSMSFRVPEDWFDIDIITEML